MVAKETDTPLPPPLPSMIGALEAIKQGLGDLAEAGRETAQEIQDAKPALAGPQFSFRQQFVLSTDKIAAQMAKDGVNPREIGEFVARKTGFFEET